MTKTLRRHFRFIFIVICYAISAPVFALDYTWGISGGYGVCVNATPEGACSCYAEKMTAYETPTSYTFTRLTEQSPSGRYCWAMRSGSATDQYIGLTSRNGDGCAPPKTLTPSGGCVPPAPPVCVYPMVSNGTSCVLPPPNCVAGEKFVMTLPANKYPKNRAGCAVTVISVLATHKTALGDIVMYEVETTGSPATADDGAPEYPPDPSKPPPPPPTGPRVPSPPMPPKPDGSCPEGTVQAGQTASGTPICIGTGTTPDNAPPGGTSSGGTTITTDEAGIKTSTQDTTRTNADGSTTTTTTTIVTRPDGSMSQNSTSTTTDAIDGKPGVSDGAKEGKGICEQNPMLSICRNSSVAGTCGEISCSGDAIQCATLRAAAAMECREKQNEEKIAASPLKTLGDQLVGGQDPMKGQIDLMMKGTEVDFSNPTLDQSGFLGGGSCLAPLAFTVSGRSVVYSFDTLCGHIQPIRFLFMAICSILSYLIVVRSVLGS